MNFIFLSFHLFTFHLFFSCKVVIFAGDCETYATKDPNVRTFKCPDEITKVAITTLDGLMTIWLYYCDAMLSNPENMNEVKSSDAVIGDAMYLCSFMIADKFSLPHVTVLMSPLSTITTGLPYNFEELPSYIPQFTSGFTDHMDFLQRAKNTFLCLLHRMVLRHKVNQVYATLKEKHNITPEKTLQQTFQKLDLVLVQSDPFEHPRPHLPSNNHLMLFSSH